jgi:hypothetical protein
MGDSIHGDGIFQCDGCGQTYAEYVNGCPKDHDSPRKVVLVVPDVRPEVKEGK